MAAEGEGEIVGAGAGTDIATLGLRIDASGFVSGAAQATAASTELADAGADVEVTSTRAERAVSRMAFGLDTMAVAGARGALGLRSVEMGMLSLMPAMGWWLVTATAAIEVFELFSRATDKQTAAVAKATEEWNKFISANTESIPGISDHARHIVELTDKYNDLTQQMEKLRATTPISNAIGFTPPSQAVLQGQIEQVQNALTLTRAAPMHQAGLDRGAARDRALTQERELQAEIAALRGGASTGDAAAAGKLAGIQDPTLRAIELRIQAEEREKAGVLALRAELVTNENAAEEYARFWIGVNLAFNKFATRMTASGPEGGHEEGIPGSVLRYDQGAEFDRSIAPQLAAVTKSLPAVQAAAQYQEVADEATKIQEEMLKEWQRDFQHFFDDLHTRGVGSFKALFDDVLTMSSKMASDIEAAWTTKQIRRLAPPSMGGTNAGTSGNYFAGAMGIESAAQGGYASGYAGGGGAGGLAMGALSGAATGAAMGSVIPGVGTAIGAVVGGLTGLVGGLFGASDAARAAATALAQLQTAFSLNLTTVQDETGQITDAQAASAKLTDQFTTLAAQANAAYPGTGNEGYRNAILLQLSTMEDTLKERAQADLLVSTNTANESLQARLMRAQGNTTGADLLDLQIQQQQEWQKALDDNKDATYMNTLATVQAAEQVALLNGTLTQILNAPAGFKVEGYTFTYGATQPALGGGAAGGGGGSSGGGATGGGAGGGPVMQLSIAAININGNRTGAQMVSDFVGALKAKAAATGGINTKASAVLDLVASQ